MARDMLILDIQSFLKMMGSKKSTREYQDRQVIYSQGDVADAIYQIQNGNVKLVVASPRGKKAVIAILGPGEIFGEGCMAKQALRMSTATAIQFATVACIKRETLLRLIHDNPSFAKHFISYLLSRMIRVEEDFVDRLFNFSEKRLARVLLMLSQISQNGDSEPAVPRVNQEQLAQMVGTTRSRVSHFMNKFRRLGYVDYSGNGALTVHSGPLSEILQSRR